MLLLHAGWCLPLPVLSSKIGLPTHKLSIYPTLKLTTHTLPYPKLNKKTTTHKEVVLAQGAIVWATIGIGWSFGGQLASAPKKHKNYRQWRNTTQQNIWIIKIKLQEFLSSPISHISCHCCPCHTYMTCLGAFSGCGGAYGFTLTPLPPYYGSI